MQPDNTMNTLPNGEVDREGAMAKADLYKLANYSLKLFKKVQDEDQMEAWVQAKITKAADYIASVYHYLEYEMKFSEYGEHLSNAEVYNESMSPELKNKLMEAKEKIKELKKLQAEKQSGKEKKVEEGILSGGEETCTECGGSGMIYREAMPVPDHVKSKVEKYKRLTKATHAAAKRLDRNNNGIPDDEEMEEGADDKEMKVGDTKKTRTGELTKTSTGVVHKNTSYKDEGDEIASNAKSGKGIKSHAKAQSAAEKKEKAPAQKMSPKSAKTWGMKDSEKFDNRDGAPAKPKKEKEVDETYGQGIYAEGKGKKPDFLDMDKDGDKKEPMNKAVADKKKNPFAKKTNEALKGGQKKLDVDGDGDIEADDLSDLRAKKEKKVDEAGKQTMSRAAKGHEKYGKEGMAALAKAGKEGKSLEPIKAKYNKYDESTAWKNKAKAVKESLDSMTSTAGGNPEDLNKAAMGLATYAAKVDPQGFEAAMKGGDEAFTKYLQTMLDKGNVQPDPTAVQQAMDQVQGGETSPEDQPKDMASVGDEETAENLVVVPNPSGASSAEDAKRLGSMMPAPAGNRDPISMNESADLDRMKQFLTRLNG
jgi:hypothetical protein